MDFEKLYNDMADLEEDEVLDAVNEIVATGEGVNEALEAMQKGMEEIGKRFEEGEYYVGDLVYSGEIMTGAMELLKPLISGNAESCGKMILCTVKDDLHDIGKNIVKAQLEANGFEVLDLGIDVPPETIVETAKKEGIKIIALSGVLTLALDSMKATVEAFEAAGMRDSCKIIIGGAPVSEDACKSVGADEWAHSPAKTVTVCKQWASE
ncbi:MAG: cobalamin-dependent protein [Clostridia bacterium]|jgi:methylmalonyl-CoA mutase cobalamin-binding domain/chain|nr:cobalamin-dependent protein [Clostridia bacterium]